MVSSQALPRVHRGFESSLISSDEMCSHEPQSLRKTLLIFVTNYTEQVDEIFAYASGFLKKKMSEVAKFVIFSRYLAKELEF